MAASAKEELIRRTDEYLTVDHVHDPVKHPAEIKAIAAKIGVARGTFYNWLRKGDPEIEALVKRIEAADEKAKAARGKPSLDLSSPSASVTAGLSDAELEREIGDGLRRAAWAMKGFVSTVERASDIAEAPLLMAELDAKVRTLGAIYRELETGPYQEWRTRQLAPRAATPARAGDDHQGGTLPLDL